MKKPKEPFIKREQHPDFEGVDLGPHHPLESEESGNKWLQEIREFDNVVDDAMNLPRRE
jgi:hypothetical protein